LNPTIPLLLAALAIASSSRAQVSPRATAATFAVQPGGQQAAFVPPGADVSHGAQLHASGGRGDAHLQLASTWDTAAIDLRWDLACAAWSQTTATSDSATRHEWTSPRTIQGLLVITWTPTTTGSGTASCAIDLFDDGSIEATGSAVLPFTLPAGVTPLRVRASTAATAGTIQGPFGSQWSFQGQASGTLTLRFEPDHCSAQELGAGCPGPQLTASGNFVGGADLRAQCGLADDLAIAVLGIDQVASNLPMAPQCVLWTTPLVTMWQPTPVHGAVSWSVPLRVGFGPVSFAAQVVAFDADAGVVTTSRALWLTCR